MIPTSLYRQLVPQATKYKRTEADPEVLDSLFTARTAAARRLRLEATRPGLSRPKLISTYAGEIRRLLFSFPEWSVQTSDFVAAYKSLIGALRPGTQFVVAHNPSDKTAIESWFTSSGHAADAIVWVQMPGFARFTDWAEDAYVGLVDEDDGGSYLMEPWEFRRSGDSLIADAVEEYTSDIRASQSPLIFQGGNCLIGEDHWYLGKDYFVDSINLLNADQPPIATAEGQTQSDFLRSVFAQYLDASRELVVLGTSLPIAMRDLVGAADSGKYFLDITRSGSGTFQPIFHIDMLMTLVGRDDGEFQVMVADPSIADQMLGTTSPYAMVEAYSLIANQLKGVGVAVTRNPIVHWPTEIRTLSLSDLRKKAEGPPPNELLQAAIDELSEFGAQEASDVTVREWHHITWNNCLVENSRTVGKHVYLPTFGHDSKVGLQPIDEHMRTIWAELGFEVHMLGDFNAFAARQGVVHCIKKYLGRGDVGVSKLARVTQGAAGRSPRRGPVRRRPARGPAQRTSAN